MGETTTKQDYTLFVANRFLDSEGSFMSQLTAAQSQSLPSDPRALSFGWFVNSENTGRGTTVYKAETDFISTLRSCPEMRIGIRNN